MLPDPMKVLHVQRLLAQGDLSQRQIARLAGVGRQAVAAIIQMRRWVIDPRIIELYGAGLRLRTRRSLPQRDSRLLRRHAPRARGRSHRVGADLVKRVGDILDTRTRCDERRAENPA